MIDDKSKLEAMRTSLEIVKKYSNNEEKNAIIKELLDCDDKENISDELMMKLIHQTYNEYEEEKESKKRT